MTAPIGYRVFITGVTGGYVGIYSLDFQDASGTSLCTGGTPSASSQYAYYSADRAFPGGATNWISNGEGAGAWLAYTFAAPAEVATVLLCGHGPCADAPSQPTTTKLQCTYDGSAWTDVAEMDEPSGGWDYGNPTSYAVPPPPTPPALADSRIGQYVLSGPNADLFVSRIGEYAAYGPSAKLFVSRATQYLVIGPPPAPGKRLGVAVF